MSKSERLRLAYERFHAKRDAAFALGMPGLVWNPNQKTYRSTDVLRYMEYEPTPAVWWWPEQKGMATLAVPNDRRFVGHQHRQRGAGLRFVGAVVPESYGSNCFMSGRNKMMRTVAGYQYGCNDDVVLDLSRIYESPANPGDFDATKEAARAADDMARQVAEEEREYQAQTRKEEEMEEWLTEARRYAHHIWCYGQLIDDHIERCETAARRDEDVYEFVEWLGEKYDLTRANSDWGIHQDVPFNKEK